MLWQLGVLGVAFLVSYAPVIRDLATIWWNQETYSHGFLILPVSLCLVWANRSALHQLRTQPGSGWGIGCIVLAGILLLVGQAASMLTLTAVSLIGMIAGLILFLLSREHLKVLLFPVSYLFFMVPLFEEPLAPLHWPFQLVTARMAVGFLQLLDFPAYLENQYIVLPTMTLEVARVCSGVNNLIAILAVGLPLAYLTLCTWRARAILAVLAVVTGIVANWARVVLIGIWVSLGAQEVHGPFHTLQGMFVSWVAILSLLAGAWCLRKLQKEKGTARSVNSLSPAGPEEAQPHPSLAWHRSWATALLVLLLLGTHMTFPSPGTADSKQDLAALPLSIGDWSGMPVDSRFSPFRLQGADDELSRVYMDRENQSVHLYIAYLAAQHHGKELVNYRTAPLHRGADTVALTTNGDSSVTVNRGRLRVDQHDYHILFWYDINGRVIANPYRATLELVQQAILSRRTNGAIVLLAAYRTHNNNARMPLDRFARDAVSTVRSWLHE